MAASPLRAPRSAPLDGKALRVALTQAAEACDGRTDRLRKAAGPILKEALKTGQAKVLARLEAGVVAGLDLAHEMSAVADEVVTALWDYTTVHVFRARNPTEGERLSLVAVGGYGRGELAPYSDLDLLFLRSWKETPHSESVIEFMLYVLWDLGLKVGWASRSVEESLKIAAEDHTVQTALLEARHVTGDKPLFDEFLARFRAEALKLGPKAFAKAKLDERDTRHAKSGTTRYVVEPNVKEGKGGLRDLNTLFWIARFIKPDDAQGWGALSDVLTKRERKACEQAFDFLWRVRINLHAVAGRAEERLTFDLQPEIARRMGYAGRGDNPAVERFMRRYFMTAKEVGALTRAFCAKLEADQTKSSHGLSRFFQLPPRRKKLDQHGFVTEAGRLTLEKPDLFRKDPVNLLRLFKVADQHDLDLHPDAFTAVNRSLDLVTPSLRRNRDAARVFLDILVRGKQPYRILSLMTEAGLLGRYIPEWGRIVAQTQFNMYHAYTVDEHTLRAVGLIKEIELGLHTKDHPLSSELLPKIEDKETLYLAMLLHDTGKGGAEGQEIAGEFAARRACERLGLSKAKAEQVAWLVRHHLVLSDYAQKRDVSDPGTVAAFAKIVQSPERLRQLLILTVADVRAVGPGVWNGWKGQLMRELYANTEAIFRGGRGVDPAATVRRALNARAEALLEDLAAKDEAAAAWARRFDGPYITSFAAEELMAHARLAQKVGSRGAAVEILVRPERQATEVIVAAPDRQGLFADLVRALSVMGASVVGAQIFTSTSAGGAASALDVFFVQDVTGAPFGADAPAMFKRFERVMIEAARGRPPAFEGQSRPLTARLAAFDIAPSVLIDEDESDKAIVIEVSGRDRPGLLGDVAAVLTGAGLSIESAHVDCYGERAVDSFYVRDLTGALAHPARRSSLRKKLMAALEASPGKGPAGGNAGKPMLKARASLAR